METFQKLIQQETGWSDAIVRFILTTEEADIYINAGLKEATVNGNFSILHRLDDYSDIDRSAFAKEKNAHWMARYKMWHE